MATINLDSDDSSGSDKNLNDLLFDDVLPEIDLKSSQKTTSTASTASEDSGVSKEVLSLDKEKGTSSGVFTLNQVKQKGKDKQTKSAEKRKLADDKAAKKMNSEMNKMYKPGECMKYMNIEGHPSLFERWYMSDVPREVCSVGARLVHATDMCHPDLIVWSRTVPRMLGKDSGQVKLTPSSEHCDCALYITSAGEISELVASYSLAKHIAEIKQLCDRRLTLVLFKDKHYDKSAGRKTSNSNRAQLSEIEWELAITDLLVSADCDCSVVKTPNELALLIVQFTKAIAEAPFKKAKRACDEQADFYMRGDSKKCVTVDKDGVGLSRLWQQMLAVLPNSSLETSRALCAKYETPVALYEAFQAPDGMSSVANLGVSRAAVPGSKDRRLGPEFARKLHALFTAEDGDMLIE